MTKEEAIKAMQDKTVVIYTGAGSLGRGQIFIGPNKNITSLRGSLESMGIIKQVNRMTADIYPSWQGSRFPLKDIQKATQKEIDFAQEYRKNHYPALVKDGHFTF